MIREKTSMRPKRHHQSIITGMRNLSSLRAGDKFYVLSDGVLVGHRREVAVVTYRGRVTKVLCQDGGTISSTVAVQVAMAEDRE